MPQYQIPQPVKAGTLRNLTPVVSISSAWFSSTISQPIFTPVDENRYNFPVNVGTFPFPPVLPSIITVSNDTISQPLAVSITQIPQVRSVGLTSTISPPVGYASWLNKTISQPFFPAQYPTHLYTWPANIVTYKAPVPATTFSADTISQPLIVTNIQIPLVSKGALFSLPLTPPPDEADWLGNSISQPFFPAQYPPSLYTWPASPATYFAKPIPPTGYGAWLNDSISQPYFTPINLNHYVWNPNAGNLRNLATTVSPAAFTNTISQPINVPSIQQPSLVSAATLLSLVGATLPTGAASWLNDTISQPLFIPLDVNRYNWPVNVGTYFRSPIAPTGSASWLGNLISQPLFTPLPMDNYNRNVSAATLRTMVTVISPAWFSQTISQPIFLPTYLDKLYTWSTDVITYSKTPAPPNGEAAWLAKPISQPYIVQLNINQYVWNPNAGTLRSITVVNANNYAAWVSKSISQPIFTRVHFNFAPLLLKVPVVVGDGWKKIAKTTDTWTKVQKPQ